MVQAWLFKRGSRLLGEGRRAVLGLQSRFLLVPSEKVNDIIAGILGRALHLYPEVQLYAVAVLSNHLQGLMWVPDAETQMRFMHFVDMMIARRIGPLVGWQDCSFWSRRYTSIEVIDDEKILQKFRYILQQGCQEDLVESPYEWPGVHSAKTLGKGISLEGTWTDYSAYYEAQRKRRRRVNKGPEIRLEDYQSTYEVKHAQLSQLACSSEDEYQEACAAMIADIECTEAIRRKKEHKTVLGIAAVLAQHPHDRPKETAKSPAPIVHTSSKALRVAYRKFVDKITELYRQAATDLRKGLPPSFPEGTFPPPSPFVAVVSPIGVVPGVDILGGGTGVLDSG